MSIYSLYPGSSRGSTGQVNIAEGGGQIKLGERGCWEISCLLIFIGVKTELIWFKKLTYD